MLTICHFKTEQSHLKRPLKSQSVSDSDKNYSILKTQLKIKLQFKQKALYLKQRSSRDYYMYHHGVMSM